MARIYQDGFEFHTTTATVATYDTVTSGVIGTTHTRTGTYAARITSLSSGTAQGWNKKFQAATGSVTFFRAYLYVVTLPSANNTIMAQTGSSTLASSMRGCIALTSSGTLILTNNGTQIGSASSTVNDSSWHLVEIKMDTTPASGSRVIEGSLDGSVFATSSAQTVGTQADIYVGGNGLAEAQTTGEWWFDDLAVNNNSGSYQTGYCGSGKILQLYPNAAGDANSFLVQVGGTVGSANNYTRVDEIPPDDATSYNASAVLNAQDLFNVQNSGIGASDTVNTVLVGARFANITGASATTAIEFQIEKTSGGTIQSSSAIIPDSTSWNTNGTSAPRNYQLITYTDPDGAAWTQTTLDSMQIGYQITATLTDAIGVTNLWASVDYTPSSAVNASVTQVAATLTFTGGTQSTNVTVTQSAAVLTFNGGTQAVAAVQIVSVAQVGATLTFLGGTQSTAINIAQVAAGLTFTGGTQSTNVNVTQSAATLTLTGGTQSIATVNIVSVSQSAATLTLTGGTQSIATVNDVALTQSHATLTFSGGTQVVSASGGTVSASVSQSGAQLIFTGGTQSVSIYQVATVTQTGATLTFTGGTQSTRIAVYQSTAVLLFSGGVQSVVAKIIRTSTWTPEVINPSSWTSIGNPNPDIWLVNPQGAIDTWDNPNRTWDSDYTWDGTTSQVTNAIISSWADTEPVATSWQSEAIATSSWTEV